MFNKKLKQEISTLNGRINAERSSKDKSINALRSEFDKKLNKIETPNTELQDKLISVLLEKSKKYVYELKDRRASLSSRWNHLHGMVFACAAREYLTRDDLKFETITVDELQKLGKYESFKANGKTYIISNKKLK